MTRTPLYHIVRVRKSDDLTFVRAGIMDAMLINANQLENSAQSTAASIAATTLPFSIDPVLWRFQVPQWWSNDDGETKRNYRRLGAAYTKSTTIEITSQPLLEIVADDNEWRAISRNAIDYQRTRLLGVPAQLDLLDPNLPRELRPERLMAPALVAYSAREDKINRTLLEEAAAVAAGDSLAAQVIIPPERLANADEVQALLSTLLSDGVSSYLVWAPGVGEAQLLADSDLFASLLRLVAALSDRGVPVGHQYGNYSIAALHDIGLSALTHHLGWVDKGEPAQEQKFALRSCQTYVPGVRHSLRFKRANDLGRHLDSSEYQQRYCDCNFCAGAFEAGEHPLDVLLEDQVVPFADGRNRRIPTSRAVTTNTWHYLLSRRLEIEAFSERSAAEVIQRDIERAAALAGQADTERLNRLAEELRSA